MSMSTITFALAAIIVTTAITWAVYFVTRAMFVGKVEAETKDLSSSIIFRIASLHGLILALVFAQELADYNEIRDDLVNEATAIADIYNDIARYGAADATVATVQSAITQYIHHVIDVEWDHLAGGGQLSDKGWALREEIYVSVLDLTPDTPRQASLREHMVKQAQEIATLRQKRDNSAVTPMSPLFWFAAMAGVVLVAAPYFTYSPSMLHLSLLGIYGGFSGLIMFLIFAFSDPFAVPGSLEPIAFNRLVMTEIGRN